MFTGIIESTAKVLSKTDSGLVLARPTMFDDLKIGCSIAVSGVCLSVTAFDASSMSFDVVATTLEKTKLGSLRIGDLVNLERALPANGRLEGHIVLGHCEGVARVEGFSNVSGANLKLNPAPTPQDIFSRLNDVISAVYAFSRAPLTQRPAGLGEGSGVGENVGDIHQSGPLLIVTVPQQIVPFVVSHGSITLDGVALTVAAIKGTQVTVAIIPHTMKLTTLGSLTTGDCVNLETDVLGKYILKAHEDR